MYQKILSSLSLMLALAGSAVAAAPVMLDSADMSWKQLASAPNLQYSTLAGNPEKNEFFVVRLRLPKDYTDVVHVHTTPRYDTIISGAYYFGFGDKVDKTRAQKMTAGSFIVCPPNEKHFGFTDEETVIQISGIGPWEALKTAGTNR